MSNPFPRHAGILLLLLLVIMHLRTLTHLLPWFCIDDERWLLEGSLRMLQGFTLDPGTHKYPGLMFLLNALAQAGFFLASQWKALLHLHGWESFRWFLAHFPFDFSSAVLTGRLLVLLLACCSVLLFFRVFSGRLDQRGVFISALLMISAPAFQFSSSLLKTDVLLLFGVLLSLHAALRILEQGWRRDYALAALGLGLCLASKYHLLVVVPLFVAHRLRHDNLSWWKTLFMPVFLGLAFLALVVFFLCSPMSFLDPAGMFQAGVLEIAIQNKLSPLLKASPVLWWHKPVLFQVLAVLPFMLGVPLYAVSLLGLARLWKMEPRFAVVVFSYPAAFLLFMILFSRLGYPHLYLPLVPFFCLLAGDLLASWLRNGSRALAALALVITFALPAYNLTLYRGFIKIEQEVLLAGMEKFAEEARQAGGGLGFIPYYANPAETPAGVVFAPQFMLSRELLGQGSPKVIFLHHAFYQSYMDNPELKDNPCYHAYLELISGRAGYEEQSFQRAELASTIYTRLLPDLLGMRTSVFVKRSE